MQNLDPTLTIPSLLAAGMVFFLGAKHGLKISRGKKGLELSLGISNTPPGHDKCPRRYDVLMRIYKISDIEKKIFELSHLEVVRQQMSYAEAAATEAIDLLTRIYVQILKKKGYKDPIRTTSGQSYLLLMQYLKERVTDKMRQYIRLNHFSERTDEEFKIYVEKNTTEFSLFASECIDNMYFYTEDITRTELHHENRKKQSEFNLIIENCFDKCRSTAFTIKKQIEKLQQEKADLIKPFST